jgi:putative PIN family toxin of toxin-antitoxin system
VRFTLDSNILVRAVTSPGGPALRLLDIILDDHILVLSRFILDEVERVLLYPRIQARYLIAAGEAARFTGNLADAAHLVEPVIVKPVTLSDPVDDPVLYTAADDSADVLCTRNTRHFSSSAVQAFLRRTWHPCHDGSRDSPGIVQWWRLRRSEPEIGCFRSNPSVSDSSSHSAHGYNPSSG